MDTEHMSRLFPSYPVLVPGYRLISQTDEMAHLRREDHSFVIHGKAVPQILEVIRAINGVRDISQLAEHLQMDVRVLTHILTRLYLAKIIIDSSDLLEATDKNFGIASYLSHLYRDKKGHYTHSVFKQLLGQVIMVIGYGELAQAVRKQLLQTGIGAVYACEPASLTLEQIQTQAPTLLLHIERTMDYATAIWANEVALRLDVPWLSGWLVGTSLHVTHVMIPGENACFECLLRRERGNYQHFEADYAYEQVLRQETIDLSISESTPATDALLVSFLTTRAIGHLAGFRQPMPVPRLMEFSVADLKSIHHPVLRLPQCPACGSRTLQARTNPYASLLDEREGEV